jgi:hypothetical protein
MQLNNQQQMLGNSTNQSGQRTPPNLRQLLGGEGGRGEEVFVPETVRHSGLWGQKREISKKKWKASPSQTRWNWRPRMQANVGPTKAAEKSKVILLFN